MGGYRGETMRENGKRFLFSVGIEECRVETFRASGPGGQHRNKVETAVRVVHPASGAVGTATDSRSQLQNKRQAFIRMAATDEFQKWHKRETSRRLGLPTIDDTIDRMMDRQNLKIEYHNGQQWTEEGHETN